MKILENLGHYPTQLKSEKEAWFLSPFRSKIETQASFKVSIILNRWYDHGIGKGGNSIDFLVLYLNISVKEVLAYLSKDLSFSFHQPPKALKKPERTQIIATQSIKHPALLGYLKSRRIPINIGKQYLEEVTFKRGSKTLFALGMKNQKEGWELRSSIQKTSSSPKSYTWLKRGKNKLIITEGMFDFLSLAVLNPMKVYEADILVLNSIAFVKDIENLLSCYVTLYLYLDNDNSGDSATKKMIQQFDTAIDCREEYKGYKDLNEKLIAWN
jgi:DNA primase